MNGETLRFESLTDDRLLAETKRLVACERTATAAVLRSLMEIDSRRLYLREGCACRCAETAWLEFHHVQPYADGGRTSADNIQLRCRAHNQYEAKLWFGSDPEEVRESRPEFFVNSHSTQEPLVPGQVRRRSCTPLGQHADRASAPVSTAHCCSQ